MNTMIKLALALVLGMSVATTTLTFGFGNQQDDTTQEADKIKQEARQAFMRGKLTSNQQIVEGLSLKDFDLIRSGAEGVKALVKGQHWFVLTTPEYEKLTGDMSQAANRLAAAATNQNIEAAALRYFDLTLTCIDCHQYLETAGN